MTLPRLVLAAPTSGTGKTTIATGLMRALRDTGLIVSPHKVGPDYIDPSWHGLASGRPGRNLDEVMCGRDALPSLLAHGAATPEAADVALIEGVMGLFDGRIGGNGFGSTASVAIATGTPVVLVVNAGSTSRSLAPVVHGFATFDPQMRIRGVIVNMVASARQEREITDSLQGVGVPIVGMVPRTPDVAVGSRHLGLVTSAEHAHAEERVAAMAAHMAEHCDLTGLLSIAHSAAPLAAEPPATVVHPADGPVVAVFGGSAFTFTYPENVEALQRYGARVVITDPAHDPHLPPGAQALVIGGGFPELAAATLSENTSLREQIRHLADQGLAIYAECAGLTYLCESLDEHAMAGVLPARALMTRRLTLGYRDAITATGTVWRDQHARVSGHEFHRTAITADPALTAGWGPAFTWHGNDGSRVDDGLARGAISASYLHQHWGSDDAPAARLLAHVRGAA